MAATFQNISRDEMETFLAPKGFTQIFLTGVIELVYAKIVYNKNYKCSLRVFTGINPSGESREVGKDAIRVEAYYRTNPTDEPVRIGGSKRVNRTTNWRKSLNERINSWETMLGPVCDKCKAPMVERENSKTKEKFWGCSQFRKTKCNGKPI